jgi:hypothetical protein
MEKRWLARSPPHVSDRRWRQRLRLDRRRCDAVNLDRLAELPKPSEIKLDAAAIRQIDAAAIRQIDEPSSRADFRERASALEGRSAAVRSGGVGETT